MQLDLLRTKTFWLAALPTALFAGAFFAWELGYLSPPLPLLPRPVPTGGELIFAVALSLLLALNAGLLNWQRAYGSCPLGTRRASGLAGAMGALALLCPVCILVPFTLFGLSISLAFLSPFIPLLRLISILLLAVSTWVLRPR